MPNLLETGAAAAGVATLGWYALRTLNRLILEKTTCILDLPDLGKPVLSKFAGRAIVCGGSSAGLLTARMMIDHFKEVVIIEPEVSDFNGFRHGKNIMQQHHLHSFAPVNLEVWRRLWPEIDDEIRKSDGRLDYTGWKLHYEHSMKPPPASFPYAIVAISRGTMEAIIRRLTLRSPRIRVVTGTVTGLIPGKEGAKSVSGVKYKYSDSGDVVELEGKLVVDATGQAARGSVPRTAILHFTNEDAGVKWLQELGYKQPRKELYDPRLWYTTAHVHLTPEIIRKVQWPVPYEKVGWIGTSPADPGFSQRGVFMVRSDGDRIFIVGNHFNDLEDTPRTKEELFAWVRGCTFFPWVYKMLDVLEEEDAVVDIHRALIGPFWRLHYEELKSIPSNFLPIGDALARFNPVYSQGNIKISSEVAALDSILRKHERQHSGGSGIPRDLSKLFLAKQASRSAGMMDLGKSLDYAWPGTVLATGDTPYTGAFLRYWFKQVMGTAMSSEAAATIVQTVLSGVAPPTELFSPAILLTVLLNKLQHNRPGLWARSRAVLEHSHVWAASTLPVCLLIEGEVWRLGGGEIPRCGDIPHQWAVPLTCEGRVVAGQRAGRFVGHVDAT